MHWFPRLMWELLRILVAVAVLGAWIWIASWEPAPRAIPIAVPENVQDDPPSPPDPPPRRPVPSFEETYADVVRRRVEAEKKYAAERPQAQRDAARRRRPALSWRDRRLKEIYEQKMRERHRRPDHEDPLPHPEAEEQPVQRDAANAAAEEVAVLDMEPQQHITVIEQPGQSMTTASAAREYVAPEMQQLQYHPAVVQPEQSGAGVAGAKAVAAPEMLHEQAAAQQQDAEAANPPEPTAVAPADVAFGPVDAAEMQQMPHPAAVKQPKLTGATDTASGPVEAAEMQSLEALRGNFSPRNRASRAIQMASLRERLQQRKGIQRRRPVAPVQRAPPRRIRREPHLTLRSKFAQLRLDDGFPTRVMTRVPYFDHIIIVLRQKQFEGEEMDVDPSIGELDDDEQAPGAGLELDEKMTGVEAPQVTASAVDVDMAETMADGSGDLMDGEYTPPHATQVPTTPAYDFAVVNAQQLDRSYDIPVTPSIAPETEMGEDAPANANASTLFSSQPRPSATNLPGLFTSPTPPQTEKRFGIPSSSSAESGSAKGLSTGRRAEDGRMWYDAAPADAPVQFADMPEEVRNPKPKGKAPVMPDAPLTPATGSSTAASASSPGKCMPKSSQAKVHSPGPMVLTIQHSSPAPQSSTAILTDASMNAAPASGSSSTPNRATSAGPPKPISNNQTTIQAGTSTSSGTLALPPKKAASTALPKPSPLRNSTSTQEASSSSAPAPSSNKASSKFDFPDASSSQLGASGNSTAAPNAPSPSASPLSGNQRSPQFSVPNVTGSQSKSTGSFVSDPNSSYHYQAPSLAMGKRPLNALADTSHSSVNAPSPSTSAPPANQGSLQSNLPHATAPQSGSAASSADKSVSSSNDQAGGPLPGLSSNAQLQSNSQAGTSSTGLASQQRSASSSRGWQPDLSKPYEPPTSKTRQPGDYDPSASYPPAPGFTPTHPNGASPQAKFISPPDEASKRPLKGVINPTEKLKTCSSSYPPSQPEYTDLNMIEEWVYQTIESVDKVLERTSLADHKKSFAQLSATGKEAVGLQGVENELWRAVILDLEIKADWGMITVGADDIREYYEKLVRTRSFDHAQSVIEETSLSDGKKKFAGTVKEASGREWQLYSNGQLKMLDAFKAANEAVVKLFASIDADEEERKKMKGRFIRPPKSRMAAAP